MVALSGRKYAKAKTYKKCPNCRTMELSSFALDRRHGDIIRSHFVAAIAELVQRNLKGEDDRNFHGDGARKLIFSNARNLSTSLSGIARTSGIGGYDWRNIHVSADLSVRQYGKTVRRTREG